MDLSSDSDEIFGPSDEDSETISLTTREVLSRLERGWINEKIAPELLPPLTDEKDLMLTHVRAMERNIPKLDKTDIRTGIHRLEIERIRFVLVSYMRIRLFKIQQMAKYLLDAETKRSRNEESNLMPQELKFLRSYVATNDEYLKTVVASNFPQPLRKLEPRKYTKPPQMDAFVFLRATKSETIHVDNSEGQVFTLNLEDGDLHIIRYRPVSFLVKSESAHLV